MPASDVKRIGTSFITEFGESAVREVREHAASARASGLNVTTAVWEQVLGYIEQHQNDGHYKKSRKAR